MEKEDFLKLLPKLIVEDNEVKGAIITALSGVMATKHDIERVIEHSDKRFEALQKQVNEINERIARSQEILTSHTQALTLLNENINHLNANFSRIENMRGTEFKTLDGKMDLLTEKIDEKIDSLKDDVSEIKELFKKKN